MWDRGGSVWGKMDDRTEYSEQQGYMANGIRESDYRAATRGLCIPSNRIAAAAAADAAAAAAAAACKLFVSVASAVAVDK